LEGEEMVRTSASKQTSRKRKKDFERETCMQCQVRHGTCARHTKPLAVYILDKNQRITTREISMLRLFNL
jgi:hypothetical protein